MDTKKDSALQSINSMDENPENVRENLGDTAGGSQVPDPSDVPGGVLGRGKDLNEAAVEAITEQKLRKTRKKHTGNR